jgi:multiple sugar transport system permease protein
MHRRRGSVSLSEASAIFILFLGALTMVLPFIWMLSTSLKTYNEAFRVPPTFIPQIAQWGNYMEVLNSVPFGRFYFNSIVTSAAITLGQLVTCSMGAYAFARLNFKGRDKIFVIYLATLMVPAQVTMIPTFIIVKWLGWIDSFKALIIPSIFSAYGTFLLRQFYMSIPMELEEAVRIDGGGAYRCFFQIILPLTKPALATLGTFVFLFFWNNFLWPLLVTNTTEMFTLPMGIQLFAGRFTAQWHLMMAASTMAMLPMIIVYLFAQKYFVEGIAMTGLKA